MLVEMMLNEVIGGVTDERKNLLKKEWIMMQTCFECLIHNEITIKRYFLQKILIYGL